MKGKSLLPTLGVTTMSSMQLGADEVAVSRQPVSDQHLSKRFLVAALTLRAVFIVLLLILIAHVSMPENSTLLTALVTPSDLVRLLLGLAVCGWMTLQLFYIPKDAHANKTWFYLGLAAVPFTLICMISTW